MSINEKMTAIADNIRDKTGGTEALTLDEMESGVNEVYEAGKKAEYNEFWDKFNVDGKRNAFSGTGWNKDTFKPNRDFTVMQHTFYYHNWGGTPYDLAAQLEELGVTMRMGSTADNNTFNCAWFTRLPELNFSPCSGTFDRVFYQASGTGLHTIDKIILPAEGEITSFNDPFAGCTKLNNVTFEGVIDKSISFSASPLSVASLKNIISCLKDYTGTTGEYAYTVTFKASAFETLEAEGATSPNGNTWSEYIDDLKWNLVKA